MTSGGHSDSKLEERNSILERVRRGELTPQAAEQWAANNGQIFSLKPDLAAFDPIAEDCWTLPMAAAWIIERSPEGVSEHWEVYRRKWTVWRQRPMLIEDDDMVIGYELEPVGPISPSSVLQDVQELPDRLEQQNIKTLSDRQDRQSPFHPTVELAFALRSGQLPAMGFWSNSEIRSSVLKEYWRPARKAKKGVDSFSSILVSVRDVLSIWLPKNLLWSGMSKRKALPFEVERTATLPPGFDQPDWSLEHVLFWINIRNIDKLRSLELRNKDRPAWYGQRYRSGLVDQLPENQLMEALITEKLVGYERSQRIDAGDWHERSLLSPQTVWFRRDHILTLWPGQSKRSAQTMGADAAPSDATYSSRKRGPKETIAPKVKRQMEHDIESGKFTLATLREEKEEALSEIYGASRTTVRKVRNEILLKVEPRSKLTNTDN